MYLMKDIVRDGDPVLRQQAAKVTFPLSDEVKEATKNMMEYLIISQDEEENEKYGLRPGVGLAAPQVGISQQFSSILIPDEDVDDSDIDEDAEPTQLLHVNQLSKQPCQWVKVACQLTKMYLVTLSVHTVLQLSIKTKTVTSKN